MTKDKEMKSLFIMCSELKQQVKDLTAEVRALKEAKSKCKVVHQGNCVEQINQLNAHTGKQYEQIENVIAEVMGQTDELKRTVKDIKEDNTTSKDLLKLVFEDHTKSKNLLKRVCKDTDTSIAHIRALEAKATRKPQAHANFVRVSKTVHGNFRPRICYNCRKVGHFAAMCQQPNPRRQNSGQANAVVEEEEDNTFNPIPNQMLSGYTREQLTTGFTPYGS